MKDKKDITPVKPEGIEIVVYYSYPFCSKKVPAVAPLEPTVIRCDGCNRQFPVVPCDDKSISFIKAILDYGQAVISPDFL